MTKSKMALAGSLGLIASVAGSVAGFAAAFDAGLIGAWTTSAPDCAKIFQRRGGGFVYRQPVDKFAQAAIIGPQQILLPSSTCNVRSAVHEKGVIKVTADCRDSISYSTQTVEIKVQSPGEIIYSPTGDPALSTSMVKCS
jgi:hypothetical protein